MRENEKTQKQNCHFISKSYSLECVDKNSKEHKLSKILLGRNKVTLLQLGALTITWFRNCLLFYQIVAYVPRCKKMEPKNPLNSKIRNYK